MGQLRAGRVPVFLNGERDAFGGTMIGGFDGPPPRSHRPRAGPATFWLIQTSRRHAHDQGRIGGTGGVAQGELTTNGDCRLAAGLASGRFTSCSAAPGGRT